MIALDPRSFDPLWPLAPVSLWKRHIIRRVEECHPWGSAALALSNGNRLRAELLLKEWSSQGIHTEELGAIELASEDYFEELDLRLTAHDKSGAKPDNIQLLSIGLELTDWQLHAWLNKLNLTQSTTLSAYGQGNAESLEWPLLVVQFEAIAPFTQGDEQIHQLLVLARAHGVYDVDHRRVALMRRLGINAKPFPKESADPQTSQWLGWEAAEHAVQHLGLPEPSSLTAIGNPLCLGRSNGPGWVELLRPPLLSLPGFDQIETASWQDARSLAAWILMVLKQEISVVRLNPTDHEIRKRGFECLASVADRQVEGFIDPIHPDELLKELAWRQQGCEEPVIPITPEPKLRILWEQQPKDQVADVSVCLSLYNYRHTVIDALDSVRNQKNIRIHLIVVDDGSTDAGETLVLDWMTRHHGSFAATTLVQHETNGGLASARNSGFSIAKTTWCFVLDADNAIHPEAIGRCLALTNGRCDQLAVVHPFIEIATEGDLSGAGEILSVNSWQRSRFLTANYVDAMALVKRSAWQTVGGYQHFPYGWEDYDFWCSLISAGYYGVICPQILATYRQHGQSMLRTRTHRGIRETSRILQKRHPWLNLSTGLGRKEGGLA